MEIGNKIVELRKKENLTQEQLAEKVGVSRQTISKWELGETSPDIKQAKNLADIFKIDINELVGDFNKVILDKVISNENKMKKLSKIFKILAIILGIILVIELTILTLISVYNLTDGFIKRETIIGMKCEKKDGSIEAITIQYDDTNDILLTEGSSYIHENIIYKKEYQNAIDLIIDINNHFENIGGKCE